MQLMIGDGVSMLMVGACGATAGRANSGGSFGLAGELARAAGATLEFEAVDSGRGSFETDFLDGFTNSYQGVVSVAVVESRGGSRRAPRRAPSAARGRRCRTARSTAPAGTSHRRRAAR